MDVRQLSYVVAVVDQGTFTRAAEVLQIAQPSLSQGIRGPRGRARRRAVRAPGPARPPDPGRRGPARAGPPGRARPRHRPRRGRPPSAAWPPATSTWCRCPPSRSTPWPSSSAGSASAHPGVDVRLLEPDDAAAVATLVRSGRVRAGGLRPAPARPRRPGDPPAGHPGLPASCCPRARASTARAWPPRLAHRRRRPHRASTELAELPLVTTPPGTSTRRVLDAGLRGGRASGPGGGRDRSPRVARAAGAGRGRRRPRPRQPGGLRPAARARRSWPSTSP